MFKLETMIYASEDGTNSVFTLNPALQKQLDALAAQHPEVCQRKARGEAGGVTYQVRGAALATPTEDELSYLAKSNHRILRKKGAFFIFGNETTPSKVPTRSSLLDTVMIHPVIKEKPILIRPDIFRNGAINVVIRNYWKPEIMKMLEKKGITHEYLFPDEQ